MYNCMGGESTRGDDAESMSPPPEPSLAISNGSLDTYPVATHIRNARRCAATASPPWAAAWRVLRVGRTRRATETETPPPRGPRAAEPPTARRRRRRPRRSLLRRSPSISTSSRRAMSCYITIYHGLISTSARRAMPCYTHPPLILFSFAVLASGQSSSGTTAAPSCGGYPDGNYTVSCGCTLPTPRTSIPLSRASLVGKSSDALASLLSTITCVYGALGTRCSIRICTRGCHLVPPRLLASTARFKRACV